MRKVNIIIVAVIVIAALVIWLDYQKKRERFHSLKREFDLSLEFEQPAILLNDFFIHHRYYPDSLAQVDTLFTLKGHHWRTFDEYRDTPYRFLIDPFTNDYFYYIPVYDSDKNKAQSFYLLSAGIDSKINNKIFTESGLDLYDSLRFKYLNYYFGKKDLLICKGSVHDLRYKHLLKVDSTLDGAQLQRERE
jgi:hypothetical protein